MRKFRIAVIIVIIAAVVVIGVVGLVVRSSTDESGNDETSSSISTSGSYDTNEEDSSDSTSSNGDSSDDNAISSSDDSSGTNDINFKEDGIDNRDISGLVALLESTLFSNSVGNDKYLSFGPDSCTLVTATENTTYSYSLLNVTCEDVVASDDEIIHWSASLVINDSTSAYTLEVDQFKDTGDIAVLSTSAFDNTNQNWIPCATNTGGVEIVGVSDDILGLVDGKSAELDEAVRQYCTDNLPSATSAVPLASVTVDFENNTVVISYRIEPGSSAPLTVTYYKNDGTFVVSR